MTPRPRILLDCDPGIDDAFAILCALKFTDLAAVTTVSGNVSITNTTRNARYLLDIAGAVVPVHRGASAPLEVPGVAADDVHGVSGLGDRVITDDSPSESDIGAVEAIADFCAAGGAVIVATGPLTNIALALLADPSLADRIDHIYWMGGGTSGGNVTEHAEFNAWADPHAVDVTLQSGVRLTMFGLNLTRQVRMGDSEIEALLSADTSTSRLLAEFLDFYRRRGEPGSAGQPMHDPCALLGLTHPELFEVTESHIMTFTTNDENRGKTEVGEPQQNSHHYLAVRAEAAAVIGLIVDAAIDPTPVA